MNECMLKDRKELSSKQLEEQKVELAKKENLRKLELSKKEIHDKREQQLKSIEAVSTTHQAMTKVCDHLKEFTKASGV